MLETYRYLWDKHSCWKGPCIRGSAESATNDQGSSGHQSIDIDQKHGQFNDIDHQPPSRRSLEQCTCL